VATVSVIRVSNGQSGYLEVLRHVLTNGRLRVPRGDPTLDAGFTVIKLASPLQALPVGLGREISRNVAAAEAIQLIGGFAQPDLLTKASPNFNRYARPDGTFHGAYGARINYQVGCAVTKLIKDPATRQAVITLWDPWRDNLPGELDYPCTVMIQFEADFDRPMSTVPVLVMNVVMRSSDAWLGLPYDMFQFAQLQLSVARALGWHAGQYRHTTLSLHLYTRDAISAEKIAVPGSPPIDGRFQPEGIGRPGDAFSTIMKRARQVVNAGVNNLVLDDPTESESWYRERFASYMG